MIANAAKPKREQHVNL